jgi:hypothetical protein
MSHLNAFKTDMTDKDALIKAICRKMGITRAQVEDHDKAQPIIGYHGTEDQKVGHIIVRARYAHIPSDIGWELKDGQYVAHVDNFDYTNSGWVGRGGGPGSPIMNEKWNTELMDYYIIEKKRAELEAKGLTVVETRDEQNHLQLRAKFSVQNAGSKIKVRS